MRTYRHSFALVGRGCKQIAIHAAYNVMRAGYKTALAAYHHPVLSCLILSFALNIVLIVAVVQRSYAYWDADHEIMELEQQNDSLRHADIRYTRFKTSEL